MFLRPSILDHLTVGELNYRSLQHEMHAASIPPPPAALPPQFALQGHSQAPRMPPPALPPQLSWELMNLQGFDEAPPAPAHLPHEHDAGAGSYLAQQLLQQFAVEEQFAV